MKNSFSVGDILSLEEHNRTYYCEVIEGTSNQGCKLACRGRLLHYEEVEDKANFTDVGAQIKPDDQWLKAFSSANIKWSEFISKGEAPSIPSFSIPLTALTRQTSLDELTARVTQDSSPWTAGTSPGVPNPTGVDYQLLCAGELLSLMHGMRGVAMVQLWFGWSSPKDDGLSPQLCYNPLVITLLQKIASNPKDLAIVLSLAPSLPDSPCLGLTALLTANKDPWLAWARHLASFGAQSALVAESAYYKLLIGRTLGYSEDNITAHIRLTCGLREPSTEVVAAVTKTMSNLAKKPAKLPWNSVTSSRGKKPKQ